MFKRRLNKLRGKSQEEVSAPAELDANADEGGGEDAATIATESSAATSTTASNNNNGEDNKPASSASRAAAAVKRAWSRGGSAGADSVGGGSINSASGSNANGISSNNNNNNNSSGGGNNNNNSGVSSKVSRRVRKGSNKDVAAALEGPDLSQFDACVEACDALAANSGSTGHHGGAEPQKHALPKDCSVLVSPDGSLLFLPTFGGGSNSSSAPSTEDANASDPPTTTTTGTLGSAPGPSPPPTQTRNPVEVRLPPQANPELFFPGEEYEAAVVVGSDLRPQGDLGENGFSARGWSATGASAAIRRASSTLQLTTQFVEDLILAKKEGAARSCAALDHLRDDLVVVLDAGNTASPPAPRRASKPTGGLLGRKRSSETASALAMNPANLPAIPAIDATDVPPPAASPSPKRGLGGKGPPAASPTSVKASPLLCPGGTLHSAAVAMEHYYSVVAEKDAARYRSASSSAAVAEAGSSMGGLVGSAGPNLDVMRHAGVLPSLRAAMELTQGRCRRREGALTKAQARVDAAQRVLDERLWQSQKSWAAVHNAEYQVQYRMEEIMRQRSRERERRRLEEMAQQQQQAQQQAASAGGGGGGGGVGGGLPPKTDQEIWELVSQIGDGVSFAPTGLPTPTLVHSHSNMSDSVDGGGDDRQTKDSDENNKTKNDTDEEAAEPETSIPQSVSSMDTDTAPPSVKADSAPPTPKSTVSTDAAPPTPPPPSSTNPSEPSSPTMSAQPPPPPLPFASRPEIEQELGLPLLRATALAADDAVEDAAGSLLNVLSTVDTTRRSARIAAETCLLSAAQAQARALREVARLERESLEARLEHMVDLERAISEMDVRMDLLMYIDRDKRHRSSSESTRAALGDDDDAGIASALAVLNTYSEGVGFGVGGGGGGNTTTFSGWKDKEDDDDEAEEDHHRHDNNDHDSDKSPPPPPPPLPPFRHVPASRDDIEEAIDILFEHAPTTDDDELEDSVSFLERALSSLENRARSRVLRSAACYALNTKRSVHAQLTSREQMEGVCRVIGAILDGCTTARESGDVSNAKLCIMLAQTFYWLPQETDENVRENRLYVREELCDHALWKDEDFWVQALFQCVAESLTQSGVLTSFDSSSGGIKGANSLSSSFQAAPNLTASGNFQPVRRKKWYDLTPTERAEAASQVHAVVFAQILALAHSMLEFGCSVGEACSFVRRLSIRHQLPISQRATLLQHLMERAASNSPKPQRRGTMRMGSSRRLLVEPESVRPQRVLSKRKKSSRVVVEIPPNTEEEERKLENLPLIINTTEPETPVSANRKTGESDGEDTTPLAEKDEAPATTTAHPDKVTDTESSSEEAARVILPAKTEETTEAKSPRVESPETTTPVESEETRTDKEETRRNEEKATNTPEMEEPENTTSTVVVEEEAAGSKEAKSTQIVANEEENTSDEKAVEEMTPESETKKETSMDGN